RSEDLVAGDGADGYEQTGIVEPWLLLAEHTDVVGGPGHPLVVAGALQRTAEAGLQGHAELRHAPVLEEEGETDLVARVARAVVAEQAHNGAAEGHRLVRAH